MKHRRVFSRRSRKAQVAWINASDFGNGASPWSTLGGGIMYTLPGNGSIRQENLVLTAGSTAWNLGGSPLPYGNEFTIRNIRGQLTYITVPSPGADPGRLLVRTGILVASLDATGGAELADPGLISDMDKSWLWLHTAVLGQCYAPVSGRYFASDPSMQVIEVNIKTRRTLKHDQALVMYQNCWSELAQGTEAVVRVLPQLRLLYSKVI